MRIVHLAPHYGGGIGTSVVGIIEAIPGKHTILGLEDTIDNESLLFQPSNKVNLVPIETFFAESNRQSTDLFLFHYWNSPSWKKLLLYPKSEIFGKLVLLHHRNFSFSGHEVQRLASHFSIIVQSGYRSVPLNPDWKTIPTCRTLVFPSKKTEVRFRTNATYFGTLSFKKVSSEFFSYCRKLNEVGINVDIWGKETDDEFSRMLSLHDRSSISYRGYTKTSLLTLMQYKFLLYPLQKNHFGTTENALLEAMYMGTVPIVKDNEIEREILGEELFELVSIKDLLEINSKDGIINNSQLFLKASRLSEARAQYLTDVELRASKWDEIVSSNGYTRKLLKFDTLFTSIQESTF